MGWNDNGILEIIGAFDSLIKNQNIRLICKNEFDEYIKKE